MYQVFLISVNVLIGFKIGLFTPRSNRTVPTPRSNRTVLTPRSDRITSGAVNTNHGDLAF